jgi:hypothetical protein
MASAPCDMAGYRNIEGGVVNAHGRALLSEQSNIGGGFTSIAANHPVIAKDPHIAQATDEGLIKTSIWHLVIPCGGGRRTTAIDKSVDLSWSKSSNT